MSKRKPKLPQQSKLPQRQTLYQNTQTELDADPWFDPDWGRDHVRELQQMIEDGGGDARRIFELLDR